MFRILQGRWKLAILFHLYGGAGGVNKKCRVMRFSELERAVPAISQKMLIQQLRELERDGIVLRTIYPQIPPKVEYQLTKIGIALRPALRALLAGEVHYAIAWPGLLPEERLAGDRVLPCVAYPRSDVVLGD